MLHNFIKSLSKEKQKEILAWGQEVKNLDEEKDLLNQFWTGFFVLAQAMARKDPVSAAIKLGLSHSEIEALKELTPTKLVLIAQKQTELPPFRFDAEVLFRLAGEKARNEEVASLHGLILALKNP